jgi:hypothetical protein
MPAVNRPSSPVTSFKYIFSCWVSCAGKSWKEIAQFSYWLMAAIIEAKFSTLFDGTMSV